MTTTSDRLLRRTLWANAILSVGSGALLAALATSFAKMATHAPLQVLGMDLAIVLELLGLGFVAFGAVCGWVASRPEMPLGWARAIFVLDKDGKVAYAEYVPEVASEPNYDAALDAVKKQL